MKCRFIHCLLAAGLYAFTAFALAVAPIADIQTMLAKPKQMCGHFEQSKYLVGMKKPLLASGRVCVVQGKAVLWRTLKPFPSTLKLTRNEIVQMQGERVAMRIDVRQEPSVRLINNLLFSLLAGDLGQLEKLFDIDGAAQSKNWQVALKARDPGIAKVIAGVTMDGGEYVKNITINEANGDRTSIVFSGMQAGEGALTADEAALF